MSGAASGAAWASALWLLLVAPALLYGAGPIPPCSPASADHCGFDRPEDLAMLPGGRWLAVSQKSAVAPLLLLDTVSGERVPATLQNGSPGPVAAWSEGACAGPPAVFEPAGIAVQRVDGELWLAAINHAKPARIELFALAGTAEQPAPEWRDCVAVPEQYALNDVALSTDGSLYATHMFTPATSAAAGARLRARFLAGEPTGHALRWRRGAGWSKVQGTALSFANGIALSHDGRWLAVSGTFDQAVLLVDLAGPERAPRTPSPRRVALGLQPDNLTPAGAAPLPYCWRRCCCKEGLQAKRPQCPHGGRPPGCCCARCTRRQPSWLTPCLPCWGGCTPAATLLTKRGRKAHGCTRCALLRCCWTTSPLPAPPWPLWLASRC